MIRAKGSEAPINLPFRISQKGRWSAVVHPPRHDHGFDLVITFTPMTSYFILEGLKEFPGPPYTAIAYHSLDVSAFSRSGYKSGIVHFSIIFVF